MKIMPAWPLLVTTLFGLVLLSPYALAVPIKGDNSFEDYRRECLQRVKQQKLSDDIGQEVCGCTISQFQKQYSLADFKKIVQKSKTDKSSARKLAEVGEACFEKVLYE
ncbi:hypothetical protein [Synechocystis sp. LKSZ1]|uniref:hypothetical protein n=1 Tax=Synechocystis sp. LKSZ1 TaxID=3144951 RepID=UPI00336C18E4